jgi:Ca-activated chloride channel family protein
VVQPLSWFTPTVARRIVAISSTAIVVWVVAQASPPPPGPPVLTLALYVTPDAWRERGDPLVLNEPIKEFNQGRSQVGGMIIRIAPRELDSGTVEDHLEGSPSELPDVWIPASSMWEKLLRTSQPQMLPPTAQSLFSSPQVFAVPDELAVRMGSQLTWGTIHRYATDVDAWRSVAGPSSGVFRLAHLNPERSTSGLSAAVSEFQFAAGHPDPLELKHLQRGEPIVEDIESAIVHYGPTSGDILEQFACLGPSYADVVYIQETSLLRFNDGDYVPEECEVSRSADRFVFDAFFPEDGTFVADYPCIPIQQEDRTRLAAAKAFCRKIADGLDPGHVREHFFRPNTRVIDLDVPILEVPDGPVLEAVQRAWREHRRLADVMVAVDTSRSMGLSATANALGACTNEFVNADRVGLVAFGDDVEPQVPLDPFGSNRTAIRDALDELDPAGGTAFLDGVLRAFEEVLREGSSDRINAVVVITDGVEDGDLSDAELDDVTTRVTGLDPPIRIFLVEDGGHLPPDLAQALVEASQGRRFDVEEAEDDPLTPALPLTQVCEEVFSFF